jgi:hypothetical protein
MWEHFFPKELTWIIINETNKMIESDITIGEFMRFIGILLFMSTVSGFSRREFWSSSPIDIEAGAPYRFNQWMSLRRFEMIYYNLQVTQEDAPDYVDKFWEVREMIELWNANMKRVYVPSWISCLDESMSIWLSKFTCPGWVFCPRKPHPFGNEYHSICDGISNIMFGIELVEGRDEPTAKEKKLYSDKGPTIGLLLRLTDTLYNTGKVVILDSGFCVLEGLIELRKVGVFASAVIKKRRYWPKHVPGEEMDNKMENRDLGDTDSVKGKLNGVEYNLFCMRDKDYVMKMMSTYGGLQHIHQQPKTYRCFKGVDQNLPMIRQFKYKEPFANHYKYRHCVDDHNNLHHAIPSIEGSIVTHWWVV